MRERRKKSEKTRAQTVAHAKLKFLTDFIRAIDVLVYYYLTYIYLLEYAPSPHPTHLSILMIGIVTHSPASSSAPQSN